VNESLRLRSATSDRASARPRLLILITLAEIGGAQTYLATLLPALTEHFDVAVAAHGSGPVRDAARKAGARFIPLRHVRRPIKPLRDALGLLELLAVLRRERPDIVHANSSKAGVLGRLAAAAVGVPVRVFTVHGWAFSAYAGLKSLLYLWADRLVSPVTTAVICVSETERASGVAARTCRADRTVVIRNAIDVAAVPRATPGDPATPRLISVGRLNAPKDFNTLLHALATVDEHFEGAIVGDGPERRAVEAELRRLGLEGRVQLLGERSDVRQLLSTAHLFVLSSDSEGLPISVLEAMAAGLPVVASAVGGVPELVVHGETGLLVPPRDTRALADALDRLLVDADLRRRFGAAARSRAGTLFDVPSFHRAHLDLYMRELKRCGRLERAGGSRDTRDRQQTR
jgi:glycosyltransferase involved in cell wall biosynthesis